jgi:GTP-binding protein EngB required for normal cell division
MEQGREATDDFVEDLISDEPYAIGEVSAIVEQLTEAFQELSHNLRKPNILLVGKTGAGKSSLINAVFGARFAETGSGQPVTQHLQKYDSGQVVIYDTVGLEHGSSDQFVNDVKQFIATSNKSSDVRDHIHVAWYVVDLAHARFQSFEANLCNTIFGDLPIFIILNKADTASPEQARIVKNQILSLKLSNCKAVFEVVSDRKNYSVDNCPKCESEDIRFRAKTKEVICDNEACNARTILGPTLGLGDLVSATIDHLPLVARHYFVNAQQVSEDARLKQAKEIIMDGAACAIRLRQSFMGRRLINMAMSLSQVWGLELYPSVVLQETAHLFAAYRNSWLQNLATFLSEMVSSRRVSASLFVAIGVEISRMLSTIRAQCIGHAVQRVESSSVAGIQTPTAAAFALSITDELLQEIAQGIKQQKLDSVIGTLITKRSRSTPPLERRH